MKKLTIAALCAALAACGYCAEKFNLEVLERRVAALEAWRESVISNNVRRAELSRRRAVDAEDRRRRAEEAREFDRWYREYTEKYGRLTLVGVDEKTNERVYRRADGVEVRRKQPGRAK